MKKIIEIHVQAWIEQIDVKNDIHLSGIIASLELDTNYIELSTHEKTNKSQIIELINETKLNTLNKKPLYLVYSDKNEYIQNQLISSLDKNKCVIKRSGHFIFKWSKVNTQKITLDLEEMIKNKSLFLADGHHRYEALKYDSNILKTRVFIRNLKDKSCVIKPFYRICSNISNINLKMLLNNINHIGSCRKIDSYENLIRKINKENHCLGLICQQKIFFYIHIDEFSILSNLYEKNYSNLFKNYTGNIIDEVFIKKFLNICINSKQVKSEYSLRKVFQDCKENTHKIAFIHKGISLASLFQLSRNHEKLNIKSTYFFPKLCEPFL